MRGDPIDTRIYPRWSCNCDMVLGDTSLPTWVRSVSALAFVVAGVGALGNQVLHQLGSAAVFLDLTIILTYGGVTLGLLGIYSHLAEASPRLARAGLVAVVITVVSIVLAIVGKGLFGAEPTGVGALVSIVLSVSFYLCSSLSFLLFGVACVRTRVPSRTVGYLLLVAVLSRVLVVGGVTEVASSLLAVSMLGAGYLLWTGQFPTERGRPQLDPTTR